MPDAVQPDFRAPVYYPTGTSSFQPPEGVAGGDFDEDGDIDLVVANYDGGFGNGVVTLLKNNGNGTFASPVTPSDRNTGFNIAVADLTATVISTMFRRAPFSTRHQHFPEATFRYFWEMVPAHSSRAPRSPTGG